MDFYTSAIQDNNTILYRGVVDGKRVRAKKVYRPRLYVRGEANGPWTTLHGQPLREFEFLNIWAAREFVKKYEGTREDVYGNQRWLYGFLSDSYPGKITYEMSKIVTAYIDIEVDSANGFPDPDDASETVTAITLFVNGEYLVWGMQPYEAVSEHVKGLKVKYQQCPDEMEMLQNFVDTWEEISPDIVTGWNSHLFDIPYLVNRISNLFGRKTAERLSPWGELKEKEVRFGYKTKMTWSIVGVAILDFQELFMKFAKERSQESYKLGDIGQVILKRKKVDYSEYGTLPHHLMAKNYQLFIDYNITDVAIVVGLNEKLKLLELAVAMAYRAKTNYEDVFSQGRMWDSIIYNKLKTRNIAVPPTASGKRDATTFDGAYVKEPLPGMYSWLASFDLTSLYPHLIMMYNISPETLLEPHQWDEETRIFMSGVKIDVNGLLAKKYDLTFLKSKHLTLTPNGQLFRTDIKGFLPEIMEEMFAERKSHKDAELAYKAQAEALADLIEKMILKDLAGVENAIQNAIKVCLNSAYGSIGNAYFRYFDIRIAAAITSGGQLSIRWIQNALNDYFNKLLKTDHDYIIGSDTDSIYISFDLMMKKLVPDQSNPKAVIDVMNKICTQKIAPFIDKSYAALDDWVNSIPGKMVMKREALVDKAIFMAKKNYILSVYDMEGVSYAEPIVKITGWGPVRTSYPRVCRDKLLEATNIILRKDEATLVAFVKQFREEFMALPLYDIAAPTGVGELDTYANKDSIFIKGTTAHIRAALIYNHYLKKMGLTKLYESIREKDKIRYFELMEPNPFQANVMAIKDRVPIEFELDEWVDKNAQFQKTFIAPINVVLSAIGWELERKSSLEDLFA